MTTLGSCIWPQSVNEEPPPSLVDQAPAIVSINPDVASIDSSVNGPSCVLKVQHAFVTSPFGLPLTARFYVNFRNPTVTEEPINVAGVTDVPMTESATPPGEVPRYDFALTPQTIHLENPDVQSKLITGEANVLWLWVSDGFLDSTSPTAIPGRYSTSTSWTINLSQCDPRYP
jgi:hypothetical protein